MTFSQSYIYVYGMSNLLVSWEEKRTSAQSERLQNSVREAGWESCGTRVCFILTMRQMTPSPADLCTITKRRVSMMRRENFWDTLTHSITATGQKKSLNSCQVTFTSLPRHLNPSRGDGLEASQEDRSQWLFLWEPEWKVGGPNHRLFLRHHDAFTGLSVWVNPETEMSGCSS